MAKMFYTLEEAAERLGVSEDEVKSMASAGRLQQFRDRDKLMFKRDQVDGMSAGGASSDQVELTDSGDTDQIDLASESDTGIPLSTMEDETSAPYNTGGTEDPRQATGISVFDADEVEQADPLAQTHVNASAIDEDELALESVGSGSGLLDLTRESDDTSLGAELLEEIYPGGGEGSDAKLDTAAHSAETLDSGSMALDGSSSGLENLQAAPGELAAMQAAYGPVEEDDPAGDGLGMGMMLGATIALVMGLIVMIGAVTDAPSALTRAMTETDSSLFTYVGILAGVTLVLGVGLLFVRKAVSK